MLCKQGDNMFQQYIVCSASKVTTFSSVNQTCQEVVNCMLRQQGDNTLIIYQSCHAIVKQDDGHYKWLTLLWFYLIICLLPSWILPGAAMDCVPYDKSCTPPKKNDKSEHNSHCICVPQIQPPSFVFRSHEQRGKIQH